MVGYWHINASGEGRSPVYCMVEKDFEYACWINGALELVRWYDFDPHDFFGEWMGDDTERDTDMEGDMEPMSQKQVWSWVESIWLSKEFCGIA